MGARAAGEGAWVDIPPAPARDGSTRILSVLTIGGEPALMAPAGKAAREARWVSPIAEGAVAASLSQPLWHPALQGGIGGGSGDGGGGGGGGSGGGGLVVTTVAAAAAPLAMRMWPSWSLSPAEQWT